MLLLRHIQKKSVILVYPSILHGLLVGAVVVHGTYRHQYYVGIGCHICDMVDQGPEGLLVMLLTGIVDTVDSQRDVDDRSLMGLQIRLHGIFFTRIIDKGILLKGGM